MVGIFFDAPAKKGEQINEVKALTSHNPSRFRSAEDAIEYLNLSFFPKSRKWTFLRNAKTANTSALSMLFEIEFGVPLSTDITAPWDFNPDIAAQELGPADVFRPLNRQPGWHDVLSNAVRLVTVRHPVSRAVSSFRYLCRTHEASHPWFSHERLRMNAIVGFDWRTHTSTIEGFYRFLEYIRQVYKEGGVHSLDRHWRPQFWNVLPEIYQPSIIGRMENLNLFRLEICEALGVDADSISAFPKRNVSPPSLETGYEPLISSDILATIADIYREDFEWLGYEPGKPPGTAPGGYLSPGKNNV